MDVTRSVFLFKFYLNNFQNCSRNCYADKNGETWIACRILARSHYFVRPNPTSQRLLLKHARIQYWATNMFFLITFFLHVYCFILFPSCCWNLNGIFATWTFLRSQLFGFKKLVGLHGGRGGQSPRLKPPNFQDWKRHSKWRQSRLSRELPGAAWVLQAPWQAARCRTSVAFQIVELGSCRILYCAQVHWQQDQLDLKFEHPIRGRIRLECRRVSAFPTSQQRNSAGNPVHHQHTGVHNCIAVWYLICVVKTQATCVVWLLNLTSCQHRSVRSFGTEGRKALASAKLHMKDLGILFWCPLSTRGARNSTFEWDLWFHHLPRAGLQQWY